MKKKLTALALVIVMVAMLFTGLTMAYFTDNETVTNTFTVGSIEIDVYEHDIDNPTKEVEENLYENVVPGVTYPKDPTIENIGKNDAYARMLVTVPYDLFMSLAGKGITDLDAMFADHNEALWERSATVMDELNNTVTYVYNCKSLLQPGEKAVLFTSFTLPATLTQEDLAAWDSFYIQIKGEAIQAEGFDKYSDALKKLGTVSSVKGPNVETANNAEEILAAIKNGADTVVLTAETTTNIEIPGGTNVTFVGTGKDTKDTVVSGQIATTSSEAGTLTFKNMTIKVDDSIVDSTGISQTGKSAIAIWGNQTVICENVTFDMSLANSTAITSWWDTGVGTSIVVRDCVFNCNGQRPIRATGNVTVENCTFNDPYRYAVQLTAKASTATELDKAIINFNNNTIVNGENGKDFVYGIQLEGADYGCHDCVINGSGNTIVDGGADSAMYYCECGKVDHTTIEWNTEVAPVHEN